jgi:hypothetical protein
MTAKYGKPHNGWMWGFTPDGKPANVCGNLDNGQFQSVGKLSYNRGSYYQVGSSKFVSTCSTGLSIGMTPEGSHHELIMRLDLVFVSGGLFSKDLANIEGGLRDANAKYVEQQKNKAQQQKTPF